MISVNRTDDQTVVIELEAVFERDDMRELRMTLENLSDESGLLVVIDFSDTTHTYYRLADLLARYQRLLMWSGSHMVLTGMTQYLQHIFTIVGHTDTFTCYGEQTHSIEHGLR